MKVRKLLVRLLNLVYLGAAVFAVYSLATAPLLSIKVSVDLEPTTLLSMIPGASGENGEGESSGGETREYTFDRALKADDSSGTPDVMSMLTDPALTEGVFDTIHLELPIEIPSLMTMMQTAPEDQPKVISNVAINAINGLVNSIKQPILDGLPTLMERIAKKLASSVIGDAIKDQISGILGDGGDVDGAFANVSDEQIDTIVNNVWDALTNTEDGNEPTVDDVVDALQGSVNEVLATLANSDNNSGFVDADGNPVQITTEDLGDIKNTMQDMLESAGLADENGNIKDINEALAALLSGLGNLTGENSSGENTHNESQKLEAPKVTYDGEKFTWEAVADAAGYVVKVNEEEKPQQVETTYSDGALTEQDEVAVKAIADPNSGKQDSDYSEAIRPVVKSVLKADGEGTGEGSGTEEQAASLEQVLDDLIGQLMKNLPTETLDSLNIDELAGTAGATLYAWYAIVGLCAFPWVLFALITFFRTLRPKKCWTKRWVVFLFAFLQIFFGALLTYGVMYGWTVAAPLISGAAGNNAIAGTLLAGLAAPEIKTLVLVPSIIYLAMIPFGIVYAIITHKVKVVYKKEKKEKKMARRLKRA